MKGKRILAGSLLGMIAAALVVVAVIKVTALLNNPESEALVLLAQLPDKVSKSYEDEFLGIAAFEENSREKGNAANIKLSGAKVNEEAIDDIGSKIPALKNAAVFLRSFQGCSCSIDIASREQQGIRKMSGTLVKGNAEFHAEAYEDGDSYQYVLPELLPGKVITSGKPIIASANKTQLRNDFSEFVLKEYKKTKEDISCRKSRETAETYEFTIPSAVLAVWVQDFSDFLKSKSDISTGNGQSKEGSVDSALADLAEQLANESSEYLFCVRGSEGVLTSLSFGAKTQHAALLAELTISVSEEKNGNTAKLTYENSDSSGNSRLEVMRRNAKSDVYENEWEIVLRTSRASFDVNTRQVIDASDNSYYVEAGVNLNGTKVADIVMDGSIKDIVEGESVHYIVDDITVSSGEKELLSMKAEVQKTMLDYKWDKPEGEEIKSTEITDEMKQEMAANAASKLLEFGFSLNDVMPGLF